MDGGLARWAAAFALCLWMGCGDGGVGRGVPCAGSPGTPFVPQEGACQSLSGYGLLSLDDDGAVVPEPGVRVFRPASELFSDYAHKTRTVYVPPGTVVRYADGELEFPVGTVLTKTFAFPRDLRTPDRDRRVIETRVLIRRAEGWEAFPYLWREDQSDAVYHPVGAEVPVAWIHGDGEPRETTFSVPGRSQCTECHGRRVDAAERRALSLLGARPRHLQGPLPGHTDADGAPVANQLAWWARDGLLVGLPQDPSEVPRAPAWDEPADGPLHARARAYLDVNCGHCHNPGGSAGTSTRLRLHWEVEDPGTFGVCLGNIIVPGDPDGSRMVGRISATGGTRMMPRIGRSVVHEEGVALIREWIAWLGTEEAADALDLDAFPHGCR